MSDMYVMVSEKAPVPARVPIGKCNVAVIAYDSDNDAKFLSASGTRISGDSWRGYEISKKSDFDSLYDSTPANTPLVKWMETYFGELDRQADAARVFFYRFGGEPAGTYTLVTALPAGGVKEWRTANSPVSTLTEVRVHYAAGYEGAEETVTQSADGYTVEEDDGGKKTGKITFAAGYPRNSNADLQDVDAATDEVLISYTTPTLGEALSFFNNVDTQLVSLAYDGAKMSGSGSGQGIYGGTSFIDDVKTALTHCNSRTSAGWARQLCVTGPVNKKPVDATNAYGATDYFSNLRTIVGAQQNFMGIFPKQVTGTSGYLAAYDGGAVVASLIRKSRVRDTLTGIVPTTGVVAYEDEATMRSFKSAQLMTFVKVSHLRAEPFLNFGYTFGIGRRKTINNVRCLYQIKHALMASLLQLVLSPDLKYDVNGMRRIKSVIASVIDQCTMNGWCDGLVSINIPIEEYLATPISSRTPADQETISTAQESGIVDNIEVVYQWGPNPETIVISSLGEI